MRSSLTSMPSGHFTRGESDLMNSSIDARPTVALAGTFSMSNTSLTGSVLGSSAREESHRYSNNTLESNPTMVHREESQQRVSITLPQLLVSESADSTSGDPATLGLQQSNSSSTFNFPSPSHMTTSLNGPQHIVVLRHGERIDHVDHSWGATASRPHDPPLTQTGRIAAARLGALLRKKYAHVPPDQFAVLSSPLIRCVETSHELLMALGATCPITIEQSLVEGPYWINSDIERSGGPRNPLPLFLSPAELRAGVSPLVDPDSKSMMEINMWIDADSGKFTERHKVRTRCKLASYEVFKNPNLEDKVLILVGHGETVMLWGEALWTDHSVVLRSGLPSPAYTAYLALQRTAPRKYAPINQFSPFQTDHL